MSYADNKRIIKNTIFLYIRTFVSMIVALYTSRKILEVLGVEDFGIFNVVGGIISLMAFINGSMSVATQRYLTYELGKGTEGQFNKVFNIAVYTHTIIAVFVLIAAETVGVWFVNTLLNIPSSRMNAANWVFQASILTSILGILQTPYNFAKQLGGAKEAPEVVFAGNNLSEEYLAELMDLVAERNVATVVISKSGTTTEPAVAFRIVKEHIEKTYKDASERIVAITDAHKGALKTLSTQEGYKTFVVPDNVGGRFSVLTPVGLLPIVLAGFDVREMIAGAVEMEKAHPSRNGRPALQS